MVTEIGGTVNCMSGWSLVPEESTPKLVMFAGPAASLEAMYTDAQGSVTVNGVPALGLFTVPEILGAITPG